MSGMESPIVQLFAAFEAMIPDGCGYSSDRERDGFRVKVYDRRKKALIVRFAPTFDEALRKVMDDLREMPAGEPDR